MMIFGLDLIILIESYSTCRMTTIFDLRKNIAIDNDDEVDMNTEIGCLKNKEQYLLYNGVRINIPRHHIVGHIELYTELQQFLKADSSLNAEKSAYQFVSRYDLWIIKRFHETY